MDDEAILAWEQAERYARLAMERYWPEDASQPSSAEDKQKRRIHLKIHYLFPQLADWQRCFLEVLYWQRQILKNYIEINRPNKNLAFREQMERLIAQFEQKYMELSDEVKEKIRFEELSPIQQKVFQREFLEIPLPALV